MLPGIIQYKKVKMCKNTLTLERCSIPGTGDVKILIKQNNCSK